MWMETRQGIFRLYRLPQINILTLVVLHFQTLILNPETQNSLGINYLPPKMYEQFERNNQWNCLLGNRKIVPIFNKYNSPTYIMEPTHLYCCIKNRNYRSIIRISCVWILTPLFNNEISPLKNSITDILIIYLLKLW